MDLIVNNFLSSARTVVSEVCPLITSAAKASSRPAAHKADGSLVTETDKAVEGILIERFRRDLPSVRVLGEEGVTAADIHSAKDARRHYESFMGAPYQIVLDPIDGTRNFVEGRREFCVAACLAQGGAHGVWPLVGVVAIPLEGVMYWCDLESVWREDLVSGKREPVARSLRADLIVSVSSKDRGWLAQKNYSLKCPWVSSGSSVYDFIGTAIGRLSGSIIGSQRLWDVLAPLAIATRLGLVLRDLVTGVEIEAIGPDDLSFDFNERPWGLTRPMVLQPRECFPGDVVVLGGRS